MLKTTKIRDGCKYMMVILTEKCNMHDDMSIKLFYKFKVYKNRNDIRYHYDKIILINNDNIIF